MKLLVIGSTGALGTALEQAVGESEGQFTYTGLSHADIEITDEKQLREALNTHKPDVVVNAVTLMGIDPCEENPQKTFGVNALPAYHLARFCSEQNIIYIQPSSHAVFDGTKNNFYTEEDAPNPVNMYGHSKLAAEIFAQKIAKKHYVVRFPTMFGPRRNKLPGFVDKMIERMKKQETIKAPDDKTDSPTYTLHVARQILLLIKENKPFGVYHLANEGTTSYYAFVVELARQLNYTGEITAVKDDFFPSKAPKPLKTSMKSIKITALATWEDALAEYLKNEAVSV